MKNILVLFCLIFQTVGCTTFLKPSSSYSINLSTVGCRPTSVEAILVESSNILFPVTFDYSSNQGPDWSAWGLASRLVAERLKELNVLNVTSIKSETKDLKITFRVLENYSSTQMQKTFYWVTTLTLGIVPSWGTGSLQLIADVEDRSGKHLGNFESRKVEFDVYNSFVMFIFAYDYRAHIQWIERSEMKNLTDDLLSKIIAAKIVCQ